MKGDGADGDLRSRAEKKYGESGGPARERLDELSHDEVKRLLHELRVHQIELEMQNEELRRAQEELEVSRAKYFDLYELAPVGYVTVNDKGVILGANLTACGLIGEVRGAVTGRLLTHYIMRDDQDVYYLHRKLLAENDEPLTCELRMRRGNGEVFWARLGSVMAREADGTRVGRIVITDITDRKKAEERAALMQTQVMQMQKIEALGQLAGGMAHDLNNILGVILIAASMAGEEVGESQVVSDELNAIVESANRAKELTGKLLTFARKDKLDVKGVDAETLVRGIEGILNRTAPKNIEMKIRVRNKFVVKCDSNQIHQALLNICNNAVDAMPGGGTLFIDVDEAEFPNGVCVHCGREIDGRYCMIKVTDTGCGMDIKELERASEPFFTTKATGKGTGLGLSVSEGIAHSHGGHLHIQSEAGKGTAVCVMLPLDDCEVSAAPAADDSDFRGTETILLVDDEELLLHFAGKLLSRYGYKPMKAGGGAIALELYKEHWRDIAAVALDIMMPGMDGGEVCRRMKEINPDVKVVYMSGYSVDGVAETLLSEKNRAFVHKPFDSRTMCRALREMIDG